MDTYFSINNNCIVCGDCIDACELDGQNYLKLVTCYVDFNGNPLPPMIDGVSDYTPCHHCNGFREDKTPCQLVCQNDAITITRY